MASYNHVSLMTKTCGFCDIAMHCIYKIPKYKIQSHENDVIVTIIKLARAQCQDYDITFNHKTHQASCK